MEVVIFFRFIIIALRITSLCVYCIDIQGNGVVGRIKKTPLKLIVLKNNHFSVFSKPGLKQELAKFIAVDLASFHFEWSNPSIYHNFDCINVRVGVGTVAKSFNQLQRSIRLIFIAKFLSCLLMLDAYII